MHVTTKTTERPRRSRPGTARPLPSSRAARREGRRGHGAGRAAAFLGDDAQRFEQLWMPRTMLRTGADNEWGDHRRGSDSERVGLEQVVRREARRLDGASGSGLMIVLGVNVEPGDGMSWSAAAAVRAVERSTERRWDVRCLQASRHGEPDSLAELSRLVGEESTVLKAARRAGLAPETRIPWPWVIGFGVLAAALAFAGLLLTQQGDQIAKAVGVPVAVLIAVVAITRILGAIAGDQLKPVFGPQARKQLSDAVRRGLGDDRTEAAFRDELKKALAVARPLAVVIDDLADLHPRTREVVRSYLRARPPAKPDRPRGEELWVVLERQKGKARDAEDGVPGPGGGILATLTFASKDVLELFRQRRLSRKDMEALVEKIDGEPPARDDPRLSAHVVSEVSDPHRADRKATEATVNAALDGAEITPLRAVALLALAAAETEPPRISPAALEEIARARAVAPDRRSALGEALAGWFPAHAQSPNALADAFEAVSSEFGALLDDDPGDGGPAGLVVAKPYADVLVAKDCWSRHGLPSADRGHLFWALYWHAHLGDAPSASRVEWLGTHIRLIREPARLAEQQGPEMAAALFEAAVDGAERSLALCLPGVAELLDKAGRLLTLPYDAADRDRAERLLRLAWTVYSLLADRRALAAASRLQTDVAPGRAAAGDPLLELYLDSLPRLDREQLAPEPGTGDLWAPIVDHARARGAWLALVVRPTFGDPPEWLEEAWDDAHEELPGVIRATLSRLSTREVGCAAGALDLATAALALMSGTVLTLDLDDEDLEAGSPVEALVDAARLATRLGDERAEPSASEHFPVDGLVHELRVISAACAGMIGERPYPREDRERLAIVVHDVAGEGRRRDWRAALRREMELLHVMWRNLELDELADMTALRRNLFGARTGEPRAKDAVPDYLAGIGQSDAARIHRLEARLLRARAAGDSGELAAVPLAAAARLALGAALGTRLMDALCVLAIQRAHAYQEDLTPIVRHLVKGPANGGRRSRLLDELGDHEVPAMALVLLNCVDPGDEDLSRRVIREIERRRERVPRLFRDWTDQYLELYPFMHDRDIDPDAILAALDAWRERVERAEHTSEEHIAEITASNELERVVELLPSMHYPDSTRGSFAHLLTLLFLTQEKPQAEVARAAEELLVSCPAVVPSESYVRLAVIVVGRSGPVPGAIRVLRDGLRAHAHDMRAEINIVAFEMLEAHDPANAALYRRERNDWRARKLRRDTDRLRLALEDGRYFEVFWYYWNELGPEIPCDVPFEVLEQQLRASGQERLEAVRRWRRAGQQVPEPLVRPAGRARLLGGDFLRLGHYVVHAAPDDSGGHGGDDRAAFEDAARRGITPLYQLLTTLDRMPDPIKAVLRQHAERFARVL